MQRGRRHHGIEFGGLVVHRSNTPTDKVQRVDDKNEVICLVLVLTLGVLVFKMSQMALYFVFPADDSKKNSHGLCKILIASDRTYSVLLEIAVDYWLLG